MDYKSIIIVFNSKNHSFYMEKLLKANGFDPIAFFAPAYLAKGCNAALKVSRDAQEFVVEQVKTAKVDIYRIYTSKQDDDGRRAYVVIEEFK